MQVRPPSPAPARPSEQAAATLADLGRGAAEVAALLERGQATAPMTEMALAVGQETDPPLHVVLLPRSTAARDATLSGWLGGPDAPAVVDLFDGRRPFAMRLSARGFGIVGRDGARRAFADAVSFLAALRDLLPADAAGSADGSADDWAVEIGSPHGEEIDLTVLPPLDDPVAAQETAARLAARPYLLAIAGEAPGTGTSAPAFAAVSSALAASALGPAWPADDLLPRLRAAAALPPAAGRLARTQQALALLDALGERLQADLAQCRARLRREQRLDRGTEASEEDAAARQSLERARQALADQFTGLVLALRESHRRALQHGGALGGELATLAAGVQPGDLVRDEAGKVVRLSLHPAFVESTTRRFAKAARRLLDDGCVLVRDELDLARRELEAALRDAQARTLSVPIAAPDPERMWEALAAGVRLDLRYRGEMPRRGFLQRLGAGRQIVFGTLMVMSLAGSFLGFNVRQAAVAGALLLVLFGGAVAWTYRAWKLEDEQTLVAETDRVREGVRGELDRLAAEVSRDMLGRLLEFVEQSKREVQVRLEQVARERQAQQATQADADRREARARQRILEQRERELVAAGQSLGRLRAQAATLQQDAARAARTAAETSA